MRSPLILALALLACGSAQAAGIAPLPVELPPLDSAPPPAGDAAAPLGIDLPLADIAPRAPRVPYVPEAGVSMPVVAATAAGGAALLLLGFALYSRLARSELLDNERRDAVHKLIQGTPGIALSDIAQRTGLGWGTTVYHLDRLEKAGFVTSESHAGRRCYFPVGTVPREARPMLGALQQETTRSVAQFVATRPGATQTELCEGLGLSASAASKQVSKLESAGLVRREREWKTVRLHPGPALASMLSSGPSASA